MGQGLGRFGALGQARRGPCARPVPAFPTCPPHFPVNCEPLASASSQGRKHGRSQSPRRRSLLGPGPAPPPGLQEGACQPTCPPAPPLHPHLARHADDGLEKLLHLVKPGLDIMGVLYGDQSWGQSRNASIREAYQDVGSQMKHRPAGSPQRGRQPAVALYRRPLGGQPQVGSVLPREPGPQPQFGFQRPKE